MSAAHEYMVKTLLKAFGIQLEDLQPAKLIPQLLGSLDIPPDRALQVFEDAQRQLLAYEQNQAYINMRLAAIMNHLGIVDPVLLQLIEQPATDEKDETND